MAEERITDGFKDTVDIEAEAEKLCRWAAARAGVIVVAPGIGTMALMANEIYMITRLADLRGIKLSESAVMGFLGSLGATFVGQTLVTLIPFAPLQVPVGISVTYAVGKVANAWLKAGRPEDIASFKEIFDETKAEAMEHIKDFKNMDCKDQPLGDESKTFEMGSQDAFDSIKRTVDNAEYKVTDWVRKAKDSIK